MMVQFHLVPVILLSNLAFVSAGFIGDRQPPALLLRSTLLSTSLSEKKKTPRAVSATSSFGDAASSSSGEQEQPPPLNPEEMIATAAADVTSAFLSYNDDYGEQEEEEVELERQRAQRANLLSGRRTYRVQLDLAAAAAASNNLIVGLSLVQVVESGKRLRPLELDLDSLLVMESTSYAAATSSKDDAAAAHNVVMEGVTRPARQRLDFSSIVNQIEPGFEGLIVSSVIASETDEDGNLSQAFAAGIRPGDVLTSASFDAATASTASTATTARTSLEEIAAAWKQRRDELSSEENSGDISGGTVTLEFQRTTNVVNEGVQENQFELTLQRPLGIEIGQDPETGFVQVTGFTKKACKLTRHAIQVGDRVVAVDASLGAIGNKKKTLWPVSTVEGVISACTARLPGQPVTLRFERPIENINRDGGSSGASASVNSDLAAVGLLDQEDVATTSSTSTATVRLQVQEADKLALLKRCRTVLQRYATPSRSAKLDEKTARSLLNTAASTAVKPLAAAARSSRTKGKGATTAAAARFQDKYAVSAMVADKVVDALASARVALDSVTLSMIMKAYISCQQPQDALAVFEAAVGFRADASARPTTQSLIGRNGGGIVPTESALNVYTGTALVQAHSLLGDLHSVNRVLHALQGQSGVEIGGLESAPWPFTGRYGSIQLDTRCHNIAIAAAEKVGGEEALEMAMDLFNSMADAGATSGNSGVQKNVVTYNTMISLLCNAEQWDKAFALFEKMKRLGVRPDKFTYTSLVKACASDDDIQELLYDMQEMHVKGDVVTYNTVIKALCEDRQWTKATKLVTEMELRGIAPDSRTYGFLMNALLKADKPTACLTLFESASSNPRTAPLTENVYLYTTAITAASVLGNHERALELVSRMSAQGVKPNMKTLTAVMGACLSANRPDLATQVFQKIQSLAPDGLAMSKGIAALCGNGDVDMALTILKEETGRDRRRRRTVMTGKQVMMAYQTVIVNALARQDYDLAKEGFADLLHKGYIPNKRLLQTMLDALGYRNERKGHGTYFLDSSLSSSSSNGEKSGVDVFRFLIFCLDALQGRNLPIEGSLYLATLTLGNQLGGCSRTVASLLVESKTKAAGNNGAGTQLLSSSRRNSPNGGAVVEQNDDDDDDDDDDDEDCDIFPGWGALFLDHYSPSSGEEEEDWYCRPPPVPVRVEPRDLRRMLLAEQRVASSSSLSRNRIRDGAAASRSKSSSSKSKTIRQ